MIERANNAAKPGRKRQAELSNAPSPKRGRPRKDTLLERYPTVSVSDTLPSGVNENQKALDRELEKEAPRKDLVLPLLRSTFPCRRPLIVQSAAKKVSITTLLGQHKCLKLPYAVSFIYV